MRSCWHGCGIGKKPYHAMVNHCSTYCPQRLVPCPLGCPAQVNMHIRREHAMNECPLRLRPYVTRGFEVSFGERPGAHGWTVLRQRSGFLFLARSCRNHCMKLCKASELEQHENFECELKLIQARIFEQWGCRKIQR